MPSERAISCFLILALSTALPGEAVAQSEFSEVVGHDFGERITQHHDMVRYLEALAASSPRVRIEKQGESWEGRGLMLAIVTSPENHRRLQEIRAGVARLGDPRSTSAGEAAGLIESNPAVVWIGGSIHGFELSGSEGVLKLLEHLTTRDDPATLEVLDRTVVLIDPMLNPDGRDAFAQKNHQNIGRVPNPRREDWANDFTSWQALKFRTGHYYFDNNRDWFAHTQKATRARVGTIQRWRPQVVVDAHEMSPNVEFFFDPATEPSGPFFPDFAARWHVRFGQAYAAAFDSAGFEYMTRERYNYFYPGYTTSYGSYQGAVGMLYEQGSTRGLILTRADRSIRSLGDALEQQYLAAWTAVRTAATRREELLREYYDAHRAALEDGRRGVRRYLVAPEGDPGLLAELANLLIRNGIEVDVLTEPTQLGGVRDRAGAQLGRRDFPPGTYVIEAAQPRNRLIRVLLEPKVPLSQEFLQQARARLDRGETPRFYDITAWSLPLLFNLGGYSSTDGATLPIQRLEGEIEPPEPEPGRAPYAYLLDGRQASSLAAMQELKRRGYRASVILEPTRIDGHEIAGGSPIVRVGQNDESVHTAVPEVARGFGVRVTAVATGLADPGYPSLGSGDHVIPVRTADIAILAEDPVRAYSFGWAWYTLDRQYEVPTTVLRIRSVADTPLDPFNVLVIPSASGEELGKELGEEGKSRIERWVREGGTLVTIGESTEFARKELELIALRSWYDERDQADDEDAAEPRRFDVPGAMLTSELDPDYWLSAGYQDDRLPVLVTSDRIYLEPAGPPDSDRRVVARYAADRPLLSGHAWDETLERIPGAVFAYEQRVGQGRVISFAEELNYRGYFRGGNRLFLNAVLLGPSAP